MKEVNIYIRTSLTGPCIKDGRWAAAMECQTSKGPAVKGICGEEQETTYYRLVLLEKMHKWIWEDEPKEESVINKEIMGIVAPTKFRMFRMQFANALFSEFQIRIMPYNGRGEPEEISYLELAKTFEQTFYPEGRKTSDSEAYERVYQMPLREKKEREVLKTEPLKKKAEPAKAQETLEEPKETEEQIPGQMEVEDYPELMPDAPAMNLPEEEKQVHEITEEVVQEGEVIEDILKSGDPEKIMQLLKKEFAWPKNKAAVIELVGDLPEEGEVYRAYEKGKKQYALRAKVNIFAKKDMNISTARIADRK